MIEYQTKDPVTGEIYDQTDRRPNTGSQLSTSDADELEYQKDVEQGQQYSYLTDVGRWKIGYLAVKWGAKWSRDDLKKKSYIKYARDIRLGNERMIYEYAQTCEFFPESAYAYISENFKFITWSHCRAVARHAAILKRDEGKIVDIEDALDWLKAANDADMNVESFEASLDSGLVEQWMTRTRRTPGKIDRAYVRDADKPKEAIGVIEFHCDPEVIQNILDLMQTTDIQKEFISYLGHKWLEKRIDK